jgi:hypothetical protein
MADERNMKVATSQLCVMLSCTWLDLQVGCGLQGTGASSAGQVVMGSMGAYVLSAGDG